MEKGYYHPERGYWQTIEEPSEEILESYPKGTIEVDVQPSPLHEFDTKKKKWIAPTKEQIQKYEAAKIRHERDRKLAFDVDPIVTNPLRWADLSEADQKELASYRKKLLAIPEQKSFPTKVKWPEKPAFLK